MTQREATLPQRELYSARTRKRPRRKELENLPLELSRRTRAENTPEPRV